jgi:hypothetical protein
MESRGSYCLVAFGWIAATRFHRIVADQTERL